MSRGRTFRMQARMMQYLFGYLLLTLAALCLCLPASAEFIHPTKAEDPLVYGVKNGIVIAVHPFSLDARDQGGPRGLIRVGYEEEGKYHLINYIAIEPLVGTALGYSELEKGSDGNSGKRFWIGDSLQDGSVGKSGNVAGRIQETPAGKSLSFMLTVEPFANGARPVIEVTVFEQFPNQIRFRTFSGAGGRNMNRCALTATMGNQSRCRTLWLRSGAVSAAALYAGYNGTGFVEKESYSLEDLGRTKTGGVVAAISPDEFEPREVWPFPVDAWHHDGKWMAQFWLKARGTYDQSLQCRLNGRRSYWAGEVPIPGGVAYENFEFRENFRQGQEVWFGYTPDSPAKLLGFGYDASPPAAARRQVPMAEAIVALDADKIARPLTNGDFSAGFEGWQSEGGANAFRIFTLENETRLTTFGDNMDADTGRLYQCFKVPMNATELRFTMHGGADAQAVYVALWHGDRLCRKMTARNNNTPFRVQWNLIPLRGQVVTLEIVDQSTSSWGFIGVQGFTVLGEK